MAGALLCCASLAHADGPPASVDYSPSQDLLCALRPGGAIQDAWAAELLARKAEFDQLWAQEGPRLVAATEAITHRQFAPQPVAAQLTLCNTPSESFAATGRVTINMRYALRSFTATPVPMRYKVDTLFHELLHIFLLQHRADNSSLLKAHAQEPERVRNHLHLLALQKAVLLQLNQPSALQDVIAIDSQLPSGYYKRAWEIVNATDTEYLKYVAELAAP